MKEYQKYLQEMMDDEPDWISDGSGPEDDEPVYMNVVIEKNTVADGDDGDSHSFKAGDVLEAEIEKVTRFEVVVKTEQGGFIFDINDVRLEPVK